MLTHQFSLPDIFYMQRLTKVKNEAPTVNTCVMEICCEFLHWGLTEYVFGDAPGKNPHVYGGGGGGDNLRS